MRQKGATPVIIILLVLIVAAVIAAVVFYSKSQNMPLSASPTPAVSQTPGATSTTTPQASPETEKSDVPAGWLTYKNAKYGFEISYPNTYTALTDKDSLSGWPEGVVLIYKGGQAYDIAIEVWDTEAQYKEKYSTMIANLTVKKIGDKFITILNSTSEKDNAEIISTFKATK